jgi:hypothetical protein
MSSLFSREELRLALDEELTHLQAAVEAEPEEILQQADEEEWAAALSEHFAVACPILNADETWMEPVQETTMDVSWDRGRFFSDYNSSLARNFPAYKVVVHIPFEGDSEVFHLRPSSFTLNPPRARVTKDDLLLAIVYPRDQQPDIDAQVQTFINSVEQWLGFARAQVEPINTGLQDQARQSIRGRRDRIAQRDAHLAQSKIPVRRRGDATGKTYIPDVLVRRPAPILPRSRSDSKPPTLEPVLEDRVFEHILYVIRMQGRQMEQSPATYEGMGEEDRRQTILATLNTHYEGRAHAEAFNVSGKTDILIRHEGRNLFICECKFWTGQRGFGDTVDQLFGYAGWRDTKLAIVMFVREKGLTAIIKKARVALERHPQFVAWRTAAEESELRASMRWPGDVDRGADLSVFLIHTPVGPG